MKKEEYLLKRIAKNDHMHGIFFDKIDDIKREDSYIHPLEKDKDIDFSIGENVFYKFNSLGFRSDEFTDKHDGKHILFAGCSETEGLGGSLDSCWAKMVYDDISSSEKTSGFYNLGRAMWGWQNILINIMLYIKKYGKPDLVCILFSNIGRQLVWEKEKTKEYDLEIYSLFVALSNFSEVEHEPINQRKISIQEQRDILINFSISMKIFEQFCKDQGIQLIWTTWDIEDLENFKNLKIFNNLITIDRLHEYIQNNSDEFINNIKIKTDWLRKRDGHSGYAQHFVWKSGFMKEYNKNG